MAVSGEVVTVAGTATALNNASTSGTQLTLRTDVDVDLGDSGVTVDGGFKLLAVEEAITIELDAGDVLYAISGTSSDVQVLRT